MAFRRRVLAHAAYAGKALAVAAVVCLALVAWPLLVQFTGPGRPHTSIQPPAVAVTDLANLVVPTRLQRFTWPGAVAISDRFTSNLSEWDGFLLKPWQPLLVAPLAAAGGATFAAVAYAAGTVLVAWALAEWLYRRGVSVRA